jgi:predicted nucleotidyltransferase
VALDPEPIARTLAANPRVSSVYIFGSQGTGTARPDSDVDIAIRTTEPLALRDELMLVADLTDALGRSDIDLVLLDRATPVLRYEVVVRGRRLFARDDAEADAWERRAIAAYLDTAHMRRTQERLLREAVG